jgi:hypothetical protein
MPEVKSISTKSGHLTATEKKHIKALFSKDLYHNKVNTKTYKIDKTDEGYKVLISENAYSEIAGRVIAGHNKHNATFTVKLVEPAEPVDEPSVDDIEQEVSSAAIEESSETENNYGINAESDLKSLDNLMSKIVNTSDKEACQRIIKEIKKISKAWDYSYGSSMLYIYLQNKVQPEMKNFTKAETINQDGKKLTLKHGKKWYAKYYEQTNRLFSPNKNTIVEYRTNGVVILEDEKYIFHSICNMDSKKWNKSFTIDITKDFIKNKLT